MNMKKVFRISTVIGVLATAVVAATSAFGGGSQAVPDKLVIAYQPGVGYTPLIIMKQQRTLERRYPNLDVEWRVLPSGAAITNGVISGQIHVGAMGTGPFLLGYARGIDWKLIAPLNEGDLWLMAKDPGIRTIADLRGKRIAMPGPTSIQAVALRKMAEVKLGDAKALDAGIVSMDHPDAMQALIAGQIDAHLTSPPFQFQEKVRGAHVVARSYQYFGAHSFLGAVVTQKFYSEYTQLSNQLYRDVQAAIKLIDTNPQRVAMMLQQDAGGNPTWRQFKQWIGNPAITFTTRPRGLMRTVTFMSRTGQLPGKRPSSWRDLVFPPVYPTKGS
ncbi:MAG TPA: ABC transporter substrate-binding protein [Candidatus Limnocylindrales bacterium]|nr:ABC transporter substrate-binding protein [Candidatus Limnocylindrales bacterium]